ncbi:hypothetical protein EXIGLDRAFT_694661 [Exidia glandulosa HHB12029]|uniref:Uncharacterized protein n=1 Tax=Exidia glandulosa HHB12029 TaxID=1314781 RepID=A0A165GGF0_EXIGL|nr:hypothetical protein EXIGLDRAFT_694661 [Exidia glandulosa HHB12029]
MSNSESEPGLVEDASMMLYVTILTNTIQLITTGGLMERWETREAARRKITKAKGVYNPRTMQGCSAHTVFRSAIIRTITTMRPAIARVHPEIDWSVPMPKFMNSLASQLWGELDKYPEVQKECGRVAQQRFAQKAASEVSMMCQTDNLAAVFPV